MGTFTTRPIVMGTRGVVTSGHYLASAAGFRTMERGGNAIDAAAAMCFCLNLLEPQSNGIGGEVPVLLYSSKERRCFAISGMGWSPKAFSTNWCRKNGIDLIPGDGYLPACVPAVVDTWATAVSRFGTLTFTEILEPAIELAENGFPVYEGLHKTLTENATRYLERYPTTGAIYCPDGRAPEIGEVIRNPDFGRMLRMMSDAEKKVRGVANRVDGIRAARDVFYRGDIAAQIVDFISSNPVEDASGKSHAGLLSRADFADWSAQIEDPISFNYRGLDVHKCSTWTQGPVFLQQLALLESFDLATLGHNSADYLHTLIECTKLAFADREAYYGDPLFESPPLEQLLSKDYNKKRRELIQEAASSELRPGDIGSGIPSYALLDVVDDNRQALGVESRPVQDLGLGHAHMGDTTHLDAVDHTGNMVAATPSGGWLGTSPVIEGLGFPLGTRGQMFYLNSERPNALEPRKRPRATLTPSLITRRGEPFMVFGTPGGDCQDQWTLQFFLNCVEFGMSIQESLDAPTIHSSHFPSSFYPREAFLGQVSAENRIAESVIAELRARGHEVVTLDAWVNGKTMSIQFDAERGVISGGVAAKGTIGYAIGW